MKYMLDTNTCIFIMKKTPYVVNRFKLHQVYGVAISSVTLAELEFGVFKSQAYERNRKTLLAFSALVSVLPFEATASREYGYIRAKLEKKGTPIGTLDTMIAAHAKSQDLVLVTNNTREFQRVENLILEDWLN